MNIKEETIKMKLAAPVLAATTEIQRNNALQQIADTLNAHADEIFAANALDMASADENGITPAVKKRLKFDQAKLKDVINGIKQLISLPDPLQKITLKRELDEGLTLCRVTCPIGVIGVIFEARPDALVQISSLCIKSGNCAILKGGKETAITNKTLFTLIHQSVIASGLPADCMLQAEQHNEIDELLSCYGSVDLLIPRGSNQFVQYIMNNTKIPVMGHADGICHTYVDQAFDIKKAIPVIIDAKTQYTAACNATETLLVHRSIASELLPALACALAKNGVQLRTTSEAAAFITDTDVHYETIEDQDFNHEYLDLIIGIKLVDNIDEAITHINYYGSHHTDCIITDDEAAAAHFMQMVDSAGVYQNCSTRFADGFRYGFGAEVGISTSKLHARGPVGLDGLVTYKYKLYGHGQTVSDYASGKKEFHFRNLAE